MNKERGYVWLWRSIDQNELLDNDNTALIVFIKLLTRVNRHTGSLKTGRNKLANACNIKPSTLYSALKRLEASTIIRQESDSISTTISICNWKEYQQDGNTSSGASRSAVVTIQKRKREGEVNTSTGKRDVIALLNKVTGRKFVVEPACASKTKSKFTDEQIEQALRNMYKDEWHGPRMSELGSDYLLRSTLIDRFKDYESPVERYRKKRDISQKTPSVTVHLSKKELLKREYQG